MTEYVANEFAAINERMEAIRRERAAGMGIAAPPEQPSLPLVAATPPRTLLEGLLEASKRASVGGGGAGGFGQLLGGGGAVSNSARGAIIGVDMAHATDITVCVPRAFAYGVR